ncbi:MAG: hypothetical protein Q8L26_07545 [Candidatus Omnitrophota bacterium]|nr:hypothetical protein [Candidatus Omnitrophota bacterium]
MLNFTFLYYGIFTIIAQLLVLREVAFLFFSNELFLGTYLAAWLFWVGMGNLFIKRLLKDKDAKALFCYSFLALSVFLPIQILAIRSLKGIFSFGMVAGPLAMVAFVMVVMGPFCFIVGSQFSLACAVAKGENALSRVYRYETLGSVAGGIVFTYLLIGIVPIFIVSLFLSFGCIICAFMLCERPRPKDLVLILSVFFILFAAFKTEGIANKIQWQGYKLISNKETRNGNLAVTQMGSVKSLFVDGLISANFSSPEADEPPAHWPMLSVDKLENVLVIGEPGLWMLKEILKHNPRRLDYVVLDKVFIDFVRPHLEKEDILALEDVRVAIHYKDARLFIRDKINIARYKLQSNFFYDAIILNIPEIASLKLNRFHTQEFYKEAKSMLNTKGMFSVNIASSENYISRVTRRFNASIFATLSSMFNNVEIIPGDNLIFLSSQSKINLDNEAIVERVFRRKIITRYLNKAYFAYKLEPLRREALKKLLVNEKDAEINRDFKPIAAYYFSRFWQSRFSSAPSYLIACLAFIALCAAVFKKRKVFLGVMERRWSVLIFFLGFASILLELVLILSFQITSGIVYWQMGVLFASFMLGLFLGSSFASLLNNKKAQNYFRYLALLSIVFAVVSAGLRFLFAYLIYFPVLVNTLVFSLLLIFNGIIVGCAFVFAGFLSPQGTLEKAGHLYSADLWGAALGAMLAGNFIIPYLGLFGALNVCVVIVLTGLSIFIIGNEKH